MAEGVADMRDAVLFAKGQQVAGHGGVEGTLAVTHGNGRGIIARGLVGRGDGVVDRHQFLDFGAKAVGAADADLLGDGEHHLARDVRNAPAVDDGLERGEDHGAAGLVVEMAGDDEAPYPLGLRVHRDHVTDVEAGSDEVLAAVQFGIDADFQVVPVGGLSVDIGVESMARGLERQDGAARGGGVGEDGDPCALGEASGPGAGVAQRQAAVVLELGDHGAERIEMGRHRAPRRSLAELDIKDAAPGVAGLQPQLAQPAIDERDGTIGHADRAGREQQFHQAIVQVVEVDHAVRRRLVRMGSSVSARKRSWSLACKPSMCCSASAMCSARIAFAAAASRRRMAAIRSR